MGEISTRKTKKISLAYKDKITSHGMKGWISCNMQGIGIEPLKVRHDVTRLNFIVP